MRDTPYAIRRGHTAAAYDAVAATYERQFLDELTAKPHDRQLLDEVAAHRTGTVIDLGCGPGQIGAYLARSGRPVVGVDLSVAMAARAARRLTCAVAADVLRLPFYDGSVSDVTAFYSLIHLPRAALVAALRELARVLAPGGWVAVAVHEGEGDAHVTEFLGHHVELSATLFTMDELTAAADRTGLAVVRAERRPPYENEGSTHRLYVVVTRL